MATAEMVKGEARQAGTKGDARRARKAGKVPAVLYGAKKEPVSLSVDPKSISKILRSATGHNTIFDLDVNGEKTKAMIVDWQYEPIKGALLHIDLKRIAMDKAIRVSVPIHIKGEAAGVKQEGGILDIVIREVEVECLPTDIPPFIDADVSELVFGKVLRVSDLPHGGKLKFVTDPNQAVAHVTHIKEEVVATPVEGVVAAEATPAEPEVIKKGKQEAEAGAEAAPAEKPEKGKKEK
jgi:large subunit ribosomal protein L25